MAWMGKLLSLPVSAPLQGAIWLIEKVAEQAEREYHDEDRVRAELMELELRHELGEMDDEAFEQAEEDLLARLAEVRKWLAEQSG